MQERREAWTALYAMVLALTFVGYPILSATLGAFDAYSRVFSIIYRAFVVFASLFLIRFALRRVPADDWKGPVALSFAALWLMLIARFAWDSSFVPLPLPLAWGDQLLMMVGVVLIPTVAMFHAPSHEAFDIARRIVLCGGVIAGVFLVVAELRIVIETQDLAALRRVGTDELNPITLGHIGTSVVIVSLLGRPLQGAKTRIARFIDSRFMRVFAGVIGAFLSVAAASKGPLVALVGVVMLWQGVRVAREQTAGAVLAAVFRMMLLVAALGALAVFLALFAGVMALDRFADFGTDVSASERLLVWTRAIQQFEASPWIGASMVEIKGRFYPHNMFLEVLLATGIAGFTALCVLLLGSAFSAARVLFSRHAWIALLLVQWLTGMMFSGSIYFSEAFWVSLAAVLAADRLLSRGEARAAEPSMAELAFGKRA